MSIHNRLACLLRAFTIQWNTAGFAILASLILVGLAALVQAGHAPVVPQDVSAEAVSKQKVSETYGKLPITFVPNAGQINSSVRYYARGPGYGIYFTRKEAVFAFPQQAARTSRLTSITPVSLWNGAFPRVEETTQGFALALRFLGANPEVRIVGQKEETGKVNYLIGSNPAEWYTGLSTYLEVVYRELWPGVDLVFHGKGTRLKYEFVVQPGARVEAIQLTYRGADNLLLDEVGHLQIKTPLGVLTDDSPHSYQEIGGTEVRVQTRFSLEQQANGETIYGFALEDSYDPAYPLIIDPSLAFSTFLGGGASDGAFGIAVDASRNAYVTGWSSSPDFPTTMGVFEPTFQGGSASGEGVGDVFVVKLGADGTPVYVTFLGGSANEYGLAIAVDDKGNVYVTGSTSSADFPTVKAFDDTFNGGVADAFVAKLDSTGASLKYATYLGGSAAGEFGDFGRSIAVDAKGNVYVTGGTDSPDFPTTLGAFDETFNGGEDAFMAKLNPKKRGERSLLYSTYLGGSGSGLFDSLELGHGIDIDAEGNAYVIGRTRSPDFPTTVGVVASIYNGGIEDGFVAKIDPRGKGLADLVYSTFVGGDAKDIGIDIAVDASGNAYIVGATASTNFPTTPGAFDEIGSASLGADQIFTGIDGFVGKLTPDGSAFAYATYLGGNHFDLPFGVAVDRNGQAYVTGRTMSGNFPTTVGATDGSFNGANGPDGDAFVSRLDSSGSELIFSTFLGGSGGDVGFMIAVDGSGGIYVVGSTNSPNFPTTAGAFDQTYGGGSSDAFVTKIIVDD